MFLERLLSLQFLQRVTTPQLLLRTVVDFWTVQAVHRLPFITMRHSRQRNQRIRRPLQLLKILLRIQLIPKLSIQAEQMVKFNKSFSGRILSSAEALFLLILLA